MIVVAASLSIISIAMGTSIVAGRYVREMGREMSSLNQMLEKTNGLRALTYEFLMFRTDRAKNQWWLTHNDIEDQLEAHQFKASDNEESFNDLKKRHARVHGIFDHLLQAHEKSVSNPELDNVLKEVENRLTGQLQFETQKMVSDIYQISSALSRRSSTTLRLAGLINMGSWVMVLLIIVINSIYIFNSVVKPLFMLHKAVGVAAGGDLSHRVELKIQNEVGDLSRAFDQMTTNLKEYTFQLERSNRELEDFAFVTSHDLQEPLRKIQTFADRLKGMVDISGERAADYLDRMEKSAGRMQALIFALFRYSGIKSSVDPILPIDLRGPVEHAVADLESLREQSKGTIIIGELPCIEADRAQMCHLFQNLIDNALRYRGDREPVVRVYSTCICSAGFFEVRVEDNGIGFEQSYGDKIFKPFQRLHGRNSPYEGTGIGLTICRRIVERHGGGITVKSEPGKGSTFTVKLPQSQRQTEKTL